MDIIEFFRKIMPTEPEMIVGGAASCVGAVFSYLIGWSEVVEALLVAMAIDYITGVFAAYINPHLALSSQKGFKGICKKIMILLLVALAHEMDKVTGNGNVQTLVVWFFLGNEGLSSVENAAKAGLPIPNKLRDALEQLASEKGGKS